MLQCGCCNSFNTTAKMPVQKVSSRISVYFMQNEARVTSAVTHHHHHHHAISSASQSDSNDLQSHSHTYMTPRHSSHFMASDIHAGNGESTSAGDDIMTHHVTSLPSTVQSNSVSYHARASVLSFFHLVAIFLVEIVKGLTK